MNRLREMRKELKIKADDIAEAISVSTSYYYDLEKGNKRLNEELLIALSAYFDCTIDYILCNDITRKLDEKKIALDSLYFNWAKKAADKKIPIDKLDKIIDIL